MKLFQQMLVAGASLSLLAPVAAQASDVVNLEELNSYSRSQKSTSRLDSKTFINEVSEDIVNLKGRVDGLEVKQNEFEAGGFSDTTTLDGKAVFALTATDHSKVKADGTDDLASAYQYTMNLNSSFTGDDNLYVRLRAGNSTGNFVNKNMGTYLSMGSEYADVLKVDKIWYTFPIGESNTVWVGPKIENYYMHATTPSIYKPVTKQFTLGGNGDAYGASTDSGFGWAYKADNGFALSSNVVSKQNLASHGLFTNSSKQSWATQAGYTTDQWSVSAILNQKYNGWTDGYYESVNHTPSTGVTNFSAIGLRSWWRPLETGTAMPSISLGFDTTDHDGAPEASNNSTAWFAGLTWQDMFQADDRIGLAFGQPTTNEDETVDPFAYEAYYEFKANDSVTITPTVFGGSDRNGTSGDDVFGAILQTTFKF
jgi:hypothetical protein